MATRARLNGPLDFEVDSQGNPQHYRVGKEGDSLRPLVVQYLKQAVFDVKTDFQEGVVYEIQDAANLPWYRLVDGEMVQVGTGVPSDPDPGPTPVYGGYIQVLTSRALLPSDDTKILVCAEGVTLTINNDALEDSFSCAFVCKTGPVQLAITGVGSPEIVNEYGLTGTTGANHVGAIVKRDSDEWQLVLGAVAQTEEEASDDATTFAALGSVSYVGQRKFVTDRGVNGIDYRGMSMSPSTWKPLQKFAAIGTIDDSAGGVTLVLSDYALQASDVLRISPAGGATVNVLESPDETGEGSWSAPTPVTSFTPLDLESTTKRVRMVTAVGAGGSTYVMG